MTSTVLTGFAVFASILAALGIYGVVSYTAARRTREMGIRAALGATGRRLQAMVFGGGMRLTIIGLAIGVVGTDVATRTMSSMLYGVGNDDPLTMAVVAAVLFSVGGVACFLPARRITAVNPIDALRDRWRRVGLDEHEANPQIASTRPDLPLSGSALAESEFAGRAFRQVVALRGSQPSELATRSAPWDRRYRCRSTRLRRTPSSRD